MPPSTTDRPTKNVIVFGETGVGKSSVVNMIVGQDEAETSSSAKGCTFESTPYDADISGSKFRLYDTAGLNEATTVKPGDALVNIYKLMLSLDPGISLLVYVVRGPRLKDITVKNYTLFCDVVCENQVPVVLVVTGLEHEESMDGWWGRNKAAFDEHGMEFSGHACITATKGKEKKGIWTYEGEYNESQEKLQTLLLNQGLPQPWTMAPKQWFATATKRMWNFFANLFNWELVPYNYAVYQALINEGSLDRREAVRIVNELVDGLQRKEGAD